jgi:P27 family predicted phage terminase small subunit
MARKAKSAAVLDGHRTKEELAARLEAEKRLLGDAAEEMSPPDYLTDAQRVIFRRLLEILLPTKLLNGGDVYMVANLAVDIDRKAEMDRMVNDDPGLMLNSSFMANRERYEKSYLRCCGELCLSPAARAKMGVLATAQEKDEADPLIAAMKGGGGND